MKDENQVLYEHEIYLTQYLKDVGLFSYDTFVNEDGVEELSKQPSTFLTQ